MQDAGGAPTRRRRLRMSPPRAAISGAYEARRDLPNRATTRKSLQTFASTSLKYYSYQTDTFIWNHYTLLEPAKYYLLDFTIPFYPLPHSVYGGVLEL